MTLRNSRLFLLTVVTCSLSVTLIGCKSKLPIVGVWETRGQISQAASSSRIDIREDGTATTMTKLSMVGGSIVDTDQAKWSMNGDVLTMTLVDIDWEFQGSPAMVQRGRDRFLKNKAKILANANKNPSNKLTWSGKDQFSITENGQNEVFHRVSN